MSLEGNLVQPRTGRSCAHCGGRLALYLVRGGYYSLCPPCTEERIDGCGVPPSDWPDWLGQLSDEIVRTIRHKEREESRRHTVSWNLIKCSECGRIMKIKEARYLTAAESASELPLIPAKRLRDGRILLLPPDGEAQVRHPVCHECHADLEPEQALVRPKNGVQVIRLFGPEVDADVTVVTSSVTLQAVPSGGLRVTGTVVKTEGDELQIGLDVLVVGVGPNGTEVARGQKWTQLRRAGDEERFDVWLDAHGQPIAEVRLGFVENGPILICETCGAMIDLREDTVCLDCAYQAHVQRRKRGR